MNQNLYMYIKKMTVENKSENSIKAYNTDILQMLNTINKPESEIEFSDILIWRESIMDSAPATINRKVIAVNKYFDFLVQIGILKSNPSRGIDKVKNIAVREKEYIPMDEAKNLLSVAKNERDAAIVAVYLTTGMRVNELVNLTVDDYKKECVEIITKGKVKRKIYFNDDCKKYIDQYIKVRKNSGINNLFVSNQGTKMRHESIERTLKVLAERCELTSTITNHSLRHTHVSYMTDNYGLSAAQRDIGHASPSTTSRYSHNTQNQIIDMTNSIRL